MVSLKLPLWLVLSCLLALLVLCQAQAYGLSVLYSSGDAERGGGLD